MIAFCMTVTRIATHLRLFFSAARFPNRSNKMKKAAPEGRLRSVSFRTMRMGVRVRFPATDRRSTSELKQEVVRIEHIGQNPDLHVGNRVAVNIKAE